MAEKKYTKFLFDDEEEKQHQLKLDSLITWDNDEISDGQIFIVENKISPEEAIANRAQMQILEGIYFTVINLFCIDNIDFCTAGNYHNFSIILSCDGKRQNVQDSKKLSRAKLLNAEAFDISEAIIELFLERDTWDGASGICNILSDENLIWQ
jgi:hypothetical protein